MLTEEVLSYPASVLTDAQRDAYFSDGAVLVEGALPQMWLDRIRRASDAVIEQSRDLSESNGAFILEDGHSAQSPRLKRLTSPVTHHPDFWAFASQSPVADAAADVVGPHVKFYQSKLNYKWADGGDRFDWHQDIQAWPHTNYSPVTIGVYLEDCGPDQGPLRAVRGSQEGKLYSMYNDDGEWVVSIAERDLEWVSDDQIVDLTGPAGSIILLNCRTIHGSNANVSPRGRPLLLNVYSAADAFPYVTNPIPSLYEGRIVRGQPARWAHHDPRPCEIPPDWSQGYVGPWKHQEKRRNTAP